MLQTKISLCTVVCSLVGQPLHKREEESGVMPIHELYLLQPGLQPNQIAPRHQQINDYGAVPNARADQSDARASYSIIS